MKSFEKNLRSKHKDQFKQNILRMVLIRVDFAPLFGFENTAAKFQKEFLNAFPQSSIEHSANYDIEANKLTEPRLTVRDQHKVFCLSNDTSRKKVKFSPTSLVLEHHKYINFEEFRTEFKTVFDFIFSQADVVFSPNRIGLRKINSFILPETAGLNNFEGYFHEGLTAHLKLPFLDTSLMLDQHFIKFTLDQQNGFDVNFQFSTEKGKKDDNESRRFILDLDIFGRNLTSDKNTCFGKLEQMNDALFDLFWCSIGPKTEEFLQNQRAD